MIALTETATTKVKELIAAEDQPELCLRVAVRPGGCSGLSYEMFFDSEKAADDIVESYGDVQVVVDPASAAVPRRRVARLQGRPPGRRASRSTTRTRSAPAAAASRSPERSSRSADGPAPAGSFRVRVRTRREYGRRDGDADRVRAERRRSSSMPTRRGESLLNVLRERLGVMSAKDGCAPQGQCGCCTVLVDGEPRVACVTPGRAGRGPRGHDGRRSRRRRRATRLADAFVATGGSQCGFCTPGIVMRFAGDAGPRPSTARSPRTCAGAPVGCTVRDAIARRVDAPRPRRAISTPRRAAAALEGGGAQRVGADVPLGGAPFADDTAPRDALVAVPLPPGSTADAVEAAGLQWVVGESLLEARARAGKVQGRRTTVEARAPLLDRMPPCPPGGVRLATQWVEPAYLEPDASWCAPGGEPASPLANGGAFGGKAHSAAPRRGARARRPARTRGARRVLARRRRAARPEAAADRGGRGRARRHRSRSTAWSRAARASPRAWPTPYGRRGARALDRGRRARSAASSADLRAVGLAEQAVLVEGALDRRRRRRRLPSGARARARGVGGRRAARSPTRRRRRSRPATRSTRSCCARTRSAPRTWRSAG